uniref:CCHC-type domain-containing protein n=1 Tax=Tanacetum cinerariifolium TaxID=118510 RepID=A0A699H9N1_TANCI|nr:hypothetical protein [Tanacetum cinerariifolium]
MSNDKESSAAGTDNRALMFEENDYESWKIRMKSVDPLAYLAHSSKHQTSTTVASPTSTSSSTLAPKQKDQSGSDAMIATMQQLVNLLSGFQKQFPPTNNQLRTSCNPRSTKRNQGYGKKTNRNGKKVICYNSCGEGHVARECKEPKRAKDTQHYKDKMMLSDAKDRGVILDAEAEAFLANVECTEPYDESLALTTTTAFQVSHEDAYDYDIDDGPHAAPAFMANLSSTEEATLEGHIKTNKDLSRANESLKAELTQCKLEMQILKRNKETKETIALGAESRAKMFEKPGTVKPINYDVLNISYIKFVPQKELFCEQVYWQSASAVKAPFVHTRPAKSEVISLIRSLKLLFPGLDPIIFQHTKNKHPSVSHECFNHTQQDIETQFLPFLNMFKKLVYQFKKVLVKEVKEFEKIFDELDDEYEQGVKTIKSLKITNRNIVREIECLTSDSIANDACAIVRTADVRMSLDAEISSSCIRELSKGLELEAEIAKKNKMPSESEKQCSHIEKDYIDLEIKFQEYKDCFESPNLKDATVVQVGPTAGSLDKQALETEITQLKVKLTSVNIQLNGYKIENQTLSKWYKELAKSNMSSRAQLMGRITALIAKNATLKAGVKGKQNSGPTQPEKPKVLTPGMFTICTKYIPPPRRENWVAPAPKPRKKQVTFREPLRPSHSTTQKTVMQMIKKPTIRVNLSTGVKPATRASKPMFKSDTRNHSTLPAKHEKVRRVEDHHRNLNKQNHVDSHLNVKHTGFILNSNTVCNACNECLVFTNLDNCVVRNLKSVNVKTPTAKHNVKTTKKVWKAKVVTVKCQWKPTG